METFLNNYWDNLEVTIDKIDTNTTYVWKSYAWALSSEPVWQIIKVTPTWYKYPIVKWKKEIWFWVKWDDRLTLTY